ncbi:MAG: helicase-exonuclease AddAB subunit AddA [Eubacteriales bacterium]
MSVEWTLEQQKVIDTKKRNLLVSAAAGSGKTAVLVERIIKMISNEENPLDIDKLLVVTFTNAAASEMKERIGQALEDALMDKPDNKHLQRQIALLQHASITTIHSFCLNILRSYFHLLNLDPTFRIADKTELTLLKTDILREVLERHYEEQDEKFFSLLESYSSNKSDEQLEELILRVHTFSISYPWPKVWLRQQIKDFNISSVVELEKTSWIKILKDYILNICKDLKQQMEKALALCKLEDGPFMYLEIITDELEQLDKIIKEELYENLYNQFSQLSFDNLPRKKSEKVEPALREQVKNIRTKTKKTLESIKELYFYQPFNIMIEDINKVYPILNTLVELVIEFGDEYRKAKKEKNIVDFNDLEHFALELLVERDTNTGETNPTLVAEELQNQFEEVLIDEYQDSNLVQETILNSVSKVSKGQPNIFMVGDVKQSIYKFRLAKPELFMEKYNKYTTEESNYQRIDLHKNFRSRKEVLDSVNFIFYQVMSKKIGGVDYNNESALYEGMKYNLCENGDCGGATELHIIEANNKDTGLDEVIDITDKELEAKMIAKRIKELMDTSNHYMVFDKQIGGYRPVQYKDIVILLRTMSSWADVFVETLINEGIQAYSDTSSGYFDTIEVRTVMSLLKVIDNPRQDIPLISILRSPVVGLTGEELSIIKSEYPNGDYYDALINIIEQPFEHQLNQQCKDFIKKLKEWRERVPYTSIYDLIREIYEDTNYYDYISIMPGGKQRQANLDMLIEKAHQFEKSSYRGLFNFIRFIDRLKKYNLDFGEASILGENEDLVRIMSIHKSKGLEFPVVFVSGLGKALNKQDLHQNIVIHPDLGFGPDYVNYELRYKRGTLAKRAIQKQLELEGLSEELRILYVAFTRAREKLILTGTVSSRTSLEKRLEKWVMACLEEKKELSYSLVTEASNYLDWVVPSLIRHKSAKKLLEKAGRQIDISNELYNEDVHFNIEIFSIDDMVEKDLMEKIESEWLEEQLNNWDDEIVYDKKIKEEVKRRLIWQYPYKEEVNVHVKMSVSELKKRERQEETPPLFVEKETMETKEITKPKFLEEEYKLSPAEKGTIIHKAMQYIPLDKLCNYNDIRKTLEIMEEKGFISEQERKSVFIKDLLAFSKTVLYKRMINAQKNNNLYKEKQFLLGIKACELDKCLKSDELVLIQGVIDCFFEGEEGIVLVDYKTDYVKERQEQILINRYNKQLQYYQKAIEQITGKTVKEKIIYSFSLNKEIVFSND